MSCQMQSSSQLIPLFFTGDQPYLKLLESISLMVENLSPKATLMPVSPFTPFLRDSCSGTQEVSSTSHSNLLMNGPLKSHALIGEVGMKNLWGMTSEIWSGSPKASSNCQHEIPPSWRRHYFYEFFGWERNSTSLKLVITEFMES